MQVPDGLGEFVRETDGGLHFEGGDVLVDVEWLRERAADLPDRHGPHRMADYYWWAHHAQGWEEWRPQWDGDPAPDDLVWKERTWVVSAIGNAKLRVVVMPPAETRADSRSSDPSPLISVSKAVALLAMGRPDGQKWLEARGLVQMFKGRRKVHRGQLEAALLVGDDPALSEPEAAVAVLAPIEWKYE